MRNGYGLEHSGKSRTSRVRAGQVAEKSSRPIETFEIVNYRDSIKIIDCDWLFRLTGIRYLNGCRLWFVKDICGYICVAITWFLIILAECIICWELLSDFWTSLDTAISGTVFQCLAFLSVVSHLNCMFTDPGAVPRGNATREHIAKLQLPEGEIIYRCPKCICIKPDRAHHCRICRRCVRKMDHHCPWVNNCIGENNQKHFILFTMYTCLISCHALYMAISRVIEWTKTNWKDYPGRSPSVTLILMSVLMVEAVIFGVFTGFMFGSQMRAVYTDETQIEQLKKESRDRLSCWLALKLVFGHPFSYRWFSPFHAPSTFMISLPEVDYLSSV